LPLAINIEIGLPVGATGMNTDERSTYVASGVEHADIAVSAT